MAFPPPLAPAPWPSADEGAKRILGSVVYSLANLEDATVVAGSADGRLTLCPHSLVLERISGSSTAPQLAIIPVAASAVAAICPVAASSVVLFVAALPSCCVATRRPSCARAHVTDLSGHDTGAGIVDVANPGSLSSLEVPVKSGPRLATAGLPDVLDLARLNDGCTALAAAGDGRVLGWDLRTRKCSLQLDAHDGACTCLCTSATGADVATAGADGTIAVWDLRAQRLRQRIPLTDVAEPRPASIRWEEGTQAVVVGGCSGRDGSGFVARRSTFSAGLSLGSVRTPAAVSALALASDSVLACGVDGALTVLDEELRPVTKVATGLHAAHCVAHDATAELTVVAGRGRRLVVFTGDTYAVACHVSLEEAP